MLPSSEVAGVGAALPVRLPQRGRHDAVPAVLQDGQHQFGTIHGGSAARAGPGARRAPLGTADSAGRRGSRFPLRSPPTTAAGRSGARRDPTASAVRPRGPTWRRRAEPPEHRGRPVPHLRVRVSERGPERGDAAGMLQRAERPRRPARRLARRRSAGRARADGGVGCGQRAESRRRHPGRFAIAQRGGERGRGAHRSQFAEEPGGIHTNVGVRMAKPSGRGVGQRLRPRRMSRGDPRQRDCCLAPHSRASILERS